MNDIFFTENVQLKHELIESVQILDGLVTSFSVCQPRIVINDNFIFEGDVRGHAAIKSLHNCGFYTDSQYQKVKEKYSELFNPVGKTYNICIKDF